MSEIFISHVEEDQAVALEIARALEADGLTTWYYERDSDPGPSYLLQIQRAIEAGKALIVLISRDSLGSWQVDKEVVRAHEAGLPIMPLLVDVSHAEFQQRRPEWRMAIGGATSTRIPPDGIGAIMPRIVRGVRAMIAQPGETAAAATAVAAPAVMSEPLLVTPAPPPPVRAAPVVPASPPPAVGGPAPARSGLAGIPNLPLYAGIGGAVLLALIAAIFLFSRGGDGDDRTDTVSGIDIGSPTAAGASGATPAGASGLIPPTAAPTTAGTAVASPTPARTPTRAATTAAASPTATAAGGTPASLASSLTTLPGTSAAAVKFAVGGGVDRNADQVLPAGNVIMWWIAGVVGERAANGSLDLAQTHTIRREDQTTGSGSLGQAGNVGKALPLSDLVEAMIVDADWTAANILIDRLGGVESVNTFARSKGHTQTALKRKLDGSEAAKANVTTAAETAALLEKLDLPDEIISNVALGTITGGQGPNYLGRNLPPGLGALQISGALPKVRTSAGYFLRPEDGTRASVAVFLLSDLPNESAGEDAIAKAMEQIYKSR